MSNADQFLTMFNKIEKHPRGLSRQDSHLNFMSLVREVSKYNTLVRVYENDLKEYAELRNAITHQFKNEIIAQPHDEVVQQIGKIYENLTRPPIAYNIASRPVFPCNVEDSITSVIRTMREKVYTHVPVFEGSRFVGVFSESSITKWVDSSAEDGGFILEETKIGDLKKYLDKPDDEFNGYKFIARDKDVLSIEEDFLSFVEGGKRLGAMFVTQTGKQNEKLLGIITAWDLPKIKKLLQ